MTIGEGVLLPINVGIDSFEPGHSQDHLVRTEGSDEESLLVFHTSESKFECDHAIGMKQLCAVRDGNVDWLTGFSNKTQCAD